MPAHIKNFKVLVADDHSLARQQVWGVLKKHDVINVLMVSNGKQAIDAITGAHDAMSPFHIVFLDWDMPNVTGIEVLSHFRKQKEYANTAFIMLTAASLKKEVLQAIKAGATAYLAKPVAQEQIEEKFLEICEWVKKHEK